MDSRRVGLIVVIALVVLALVGAGVQGVMHQQWMEGFAVGQMAAQGASAASGMAAPVAARVVAPAYDGGFQHHSPLAIFFQILFFFLMVKIGFRILRRVAWRHNMMQNSAAWGQPGNPQPWAQGQMPPWARHGFHMHCGRGAWNAQPNQANAQPAAQAQTAPQSAPTYGPQAPVDL